MTNSAHFIFLFFLLLALPLPPAACPLPYKCWPLCMLISLGRVQEARRGKAKRKKGDTASASLNKLCCHLSHLMVFAFVYQQSVSIIITHSAPLPSPFSLYFIPTICQLHSIASSSFWSALDSYIFLYKYLRGILSGFFILSDLCRFAKSHSHKKKKTSSKMSFSVRPLF